MKVTRELAVSTVKRCFKVVRLWEASDAPNVNFRGGTAKQVSDAVAQAIDQVCFLCGASDVDDDAKELVLAIELFQSEVHAWREAIEVAPESMHPAGTADMWSAFNVLERYLEPKRRRLPEPIRELMDAKVSDEQICKIYGFVKADGSADVVKLAEEKANPGTHYNPETWMPRREQTRLEEVKEQWRKRTPIDHIPIGSEPVEAKPRRTAPEPIDELIAQGVSAEQIAKMKQITVEEVEAYAVKRGLPLEGRFRPTKAEDHDAGAALSGRRAELYPKSHPEIMDMEERILECALDKMKVTDIADALQVDHPGLTWQKVNAIITKLEKDGAEAAATEAKQAGA
jgi:hypothetical protein